MRLRMLPLVALAAATSMTACSSSTISASEIRVDAGGGKSGVTNGSTPVGGSVVVRVRDVCTTGKPMSITSISTVNATGGMHVTSWGVRAVTPRSSYPVSDNVGASDGLVSQFHSFTHDPVTVTCAESFNKDATTVEQLDISVAGTASRASMTGYTVHFASGSAQGQFAVLNCVTSVCNGLPGFPG